MSTPPTEMIWLMMKAATKAPNMLPRPPSTQIMKVRGPKAPPKYGCTAYWMMSNAPAMPAMAPPHRGGDEIEPERVRAHEGGGVTILRDGTDGRAHEGAGEEEIEAEHGEDGQAEGDQAGKGDEDATHLEHGQVHAHRAMVRAPEEGGEGLDEEEESPRGQELVDGRARQDGRDDQEVDEEAQDHPRHDRAHPGQHDGPVVDGDQEV